MEINIEDIVVEIYDQSSGDISCFLSINNFNYYNNFKLIGKSDILEISGIYNSLNLSNVNCETIIYSDQSGDSIKNHILPMGLKKLYCNEQNITSLPIILPSTLEKIYLNNNKIKHLPDKLPESLRKMEVNNNKIESIDNIIFIPNGLKYIKLYNNPINISEFIGNNIKNYNKFNQEDEAWNEYYENDVNIEYYENNY